jgi:hypothetical protein
MSKRPRRAPARFDGEGDDAALDSARRSTASMASVHVPPAPVFRPTVAEWADPCAYLASVAHAGAWLVGWNARARACSRSPSPRACV